MEGRATRPEKRSGWGFLPCCPDQWFGDDSMLTFDARLDANRTRDQRLTYVTSTAWRLRSFPAIVAAMRAVIQRVSEASVTVDGRVVGAIGRGYLVLLGVTHGDGPEHVEWMAAKIAGLRLFADDQGLTNLSLADVGGAVLVVSQFTLYADARKGRRPSFTDAAPPEVAEPLVSSFIAGLQTQGLRVASGLFRAEMQVALVNDGPVTLILER